MLDKLLGIVLLMGLIASFVLADMPAVNNWFGPALTEQLHYMKANIFWILPLALFLLYWRNWGIEPFMVGRVAVVVIILTVILYFMQSGGAFG